MPQFDIVLRHQMILRPRNKIICPTCLAGFSVTDPNLQAA